MQTGGADEDDVRADDVLLLLLDADEVMLIELDLELELALMLELDLLDEGSAELLVALLELELDFAELLELLAFEDVVAFEDVLAFDDVLGLEDVATLLDLEGSVLLLAEELRDEEALLEVVGAADEVFDDTELEVLRPLLVALEDVFLVEEEPGSDDDLLDVF